MKLEKLRTEINKIDKEIVLLLGRRFNLARKVSAFKKINKVSIEDKLREQKIIKKIKILGSNRRVDPSWLTKVFRLIIRESKRIQKETI